MTVKDKEVQEVDALEEGEKVLVGSDHGGCLHACDAQFFGAVAKSSSTGKIEQQRRRRSSRAGALDENDDSPILGRDVDGARELAVVGAD